jgi:hypothetical protein
MMLHQVSAGTTNVISLPPHHNPIRHACLLLLLLSTGFGFRNMTMQVEIGTEAVSPADTQWAQQTLGALLPASRGRLFWNHFQCLDNSTDPEWAWRSYFGEHARQLLAVKKIWDPQGRINAMNCSALN